MSSNLDIFHAYTFGTAFWYALRGSARIYDAAMVCGWFRHNVQPPNDLELYTVHTDAWGLMTLALILLALTDSVPMTYPFSLFAPSNLTSTSTNSGKKALAKAIVLATIFHHVTTGYGAYTYWADPGKYTAAMSIGVYGCAGLAALGVAALVWGMDDGSIAGSEKVKKAA